MKERANLISGNFVLPCCKSEFDIAYSRCHTVFTKLGAICYAGITGLKYQIEDIQSGEAYIYCEECEKRTIFRVQEGKIVEIYRKVRPVSLDHLNKSSLELEDFFAEEWDQEEYDEELTTKEAKA